MKIGKAHELNEAGPEQFEKLAAEIGFAKPLVKRKVIDLAKSMLEQVDQVEVEHSAINEIKGFIRDHCTDVLNRFTNVTGKSKV